MSVYKRGTHWHYDFSINKRRYRGPLPSAKTKQQATKAEAEVRLSVFEGRYGQAEKNNRFCHFRKRNLPALVQAQQTFGSQ